MTEKTSGEVWAAIEGLRTAQGVSAIANQRTEARMDEVLDELKKLTQAVGWTGTDERGSPIGVGIRGDLMRLETKVNGRFSLYDGLRKYASGALFSAGIAIVVLWWLLEDRFATLFRWTAQ